MRVFSAAALTLLLGCSARSSECARLGEVLAPVVAAASPGGDPNAQDALLKAIDQAEAGLARLALTAPDLAAHAAELRVALDRRRSPAREILRLRRRSPSPKDQREIYAGIARAQRRVEQSIQEISTRCRDKRPDCATFAEAIGQAPTQEAIDPGDAKKMRAWADATNRWAEGLAKSKVADPEIARCLFDLQKGWFDVGAGMVRLAEVTADELDAGAQQKAADEAEAAFTDRVDALNRLCQRGR
jgi:hypothetical protein